MYLVIKITPCYQQYYRIFHYMTEEKTIDLKDRIAEMKGIPNEELLLENLKQKTMIVTFDNLNGDERIMTCTKNFDIIPEDNRPKTDKKPAEGNITVWDLTAKGWRSFKYNRVKKVEILQQR